MNATDIWWKIGNGLDYILAAIYDENLGITTGFNLFVIGFLFIAILYWLSRQVKFNKQAKNNPNQLK